MASRQDCRRAARRAGLLGGGIRSATFGLGVLQALHALGVFRHIDYLSTVSGGGYIGAWLQGATSRGRRDDALSIERQEPRDVRFLRAYSNYLTPKLGLFSGDTWAAVGNSARNLVLNLSVLSLSLLAPLYLPWLGALLFWRLVPSAPAAVGTLWTAGGLLALTVAISTLNMARPLKDGTWSKAGAFQASTWQVQVLVVVPALVAAALLSTVAWAWSRHEWLESGTYLFAVVWRGGIAYGVIWLVGAVSGYMHCLTAIRGSTGDDGPGPKDHAPRRSVGGRRGARRARHHRNGGRRHRHIRVERLHAGVRICRQGLEHVAHRPACVSDCRAEPAHHRDGAHWIGGPPAVG